MGNPAEMKIMNLLPNTKLKRFCFRGLLTLTLIIGCTVRSAVLTHRYSFDADANDSISGANGTLQDNTVLTNGGVLIGRGGGVGLPANLFTNYDSITFEVWLTDLNFPNINLSAFDAAVYSEYAYNFSGAGGGMNFAIFNNNNSGGLWTQSNVSMSIDMPLPVPGQTNHLVWTQDSNSLTACLYLNGLLVGSLTNFSLEPTLIGPTTINEIGNSKPGNTNSYFNGSILEFRTYQGALSPLEVAQSDAAGPDQILTNPGDSEDVRIVLPSQIGPGALLQPAVYADFSNLTNVNVTGQSDLNLLSDNTNVIVVTTGRKLMTIGPGIANITAVYSGYTNTRAAMVSAPQDIALIHRYSFNEPTNTWVAYDSVNGANGRVFGPFAVIESIPGSLTPVSYASFTGQGELIMRSEQEAYQSGGAYVALPAGIISCLSEVSIEAWLTWTPEGVQPSFPGGVNWEMIFDFGSQNSGEGVSYLFLTPRTDNQYKTTNYIMRSSITTNFNNAETPLLDWTKVCPTNGESLLTVTYSPVRGVAKLYLNGVLCSSGIASLPLSGINDTNNWLGRSQFATDPFLYGRYDEFRIYSGLLSDSDVAADYAAGPNVIGVDYVLHVYATPSSLTITWGPTAANLVLQSSAELGEGAAWNLVPMTPVLQNGRYNVAVPISGNASYFRLSTP